MSTFVVGFSSCSSNALTLDTPRNYINHLKKKINKSRTLGFEIDDPVVKEMWSKFCHGLSGV
jgi:hypothetical protein